MRHRYYKKVILICAALIISAAAKGGDHQYWNINYNGLGNGIDEPSAVAVDSYGFIYITGSSEGSGTGFDFATIKYDAQGNRIWVSIYNGPDNADDRAFSLAVDASGNVYVAGFSTSQSGRKDYLTIKYNSSGTQVWTQRYDGTSNRDDEANALVIDSEGNVYVTGYSNGEGTQKDYLTIKYLSDGVQSWVVRYDGEGNKNDEATAMVMSVGYLYVTGFTKGDGGAGDYTTIKYSLSGIQQWVVDYPGDRKAKANAIASDSEGNIYVTGYTKVQGENNNYTTVKYNSEGLQVWVRQYNGPANGDDEASSIGADLNNNIYITGKSKGNTTGFDYATVKYNSNGDELWSARYNGPAGGDDIASAISVDAGEWYTLQERAGETEPVLI